MFKLIWLFFRIGAMNELQYRVNFFIQLFQSLVALGTGLIELAVVFSHTTTLAGWSRPELLVVMGVYTLMGGLINLTIQPNMLQLLNDVQQGTLDYILTRPADAQLQVSVRQVHIWSATDILLGMGVLFVAFFQLQSTLGILQAIIFTALLLLVDTVGILFTVLALLVNLLLVGLGFRYASHFARWMGQQGMRGVSKLISLLLAAIAVSLIRRGWQTQ